MELDDAHRDDKNAAMQSAIAPDRGDCAAVGRVLLVEDCWPVLCVIDRGRGHVVDATTNAATSPDRELL
mgnify:CR=1 FL=1